MPIGVRDFNRYGKVAHASLERAKAYFGIVNVGAVLAALAAVFERLFRDFLAVLIENDAPGERSVLQRVMGIHIGGNPSRERVLAKAERRAAARPVSMNVNREAVFDVGFACDEQIARAAVPVGENEINRVFVHHRDCQTAAIAASGVAFRLAFPRSTT